MKKVPWHRGTGCANGEPALATIAAHARHNIDASVGMCAVPVKADDGCGDNWDVHGGTSRTDLGDASLGQRGGRTLASVHSF